MGTTANIPGVGAVSVGDRVQVLHSNGAKPRKAWAEVLAFQNGKGTVTELTVSWPSRATGQRAVRPDMVVAVENAKPAKVAAITHASLFDNWTHTFGPREWEARETLEEKLAEFAVVGVLTLKLRADPTAPHNVYVIGADAELAAFGPNYLDAFGVAFDPDLGVWWRFAGYAPANEL